MTQEQELLIEQHMDIARNKSRKWARSQDVLSYDELLSTAYMALVKAAQSYDATRGCHFVGYCSICIDNAIRSEMRAPILNKQNSSSSDVDLVIEELHGADIEDLIALRQAVARLPQREKELLQRYMSDNMNQRKLASELGCSQTRVYEELREIYEFLRHQMT
jgi:RNA polymerase sigma factor (sigma-70 family)